RDDWASQSARSTCPRRRINGGDLWYWPIVRYRPKADKADALTDVFELVCAFDEVVLTNALNKQEHAVRFRAVRDEMRGSRCYLIASSRLKHKLIIRITRSNAKCAAENKVVVSTLTVTVPRDELVGRKREDTCLNIRSNDNGLDIFYGIIWLR